MPNRYVREAAIKSRSVNAISWQAEVFWRRLLNLVDDFGRYSADPAILRADVFPRQLEKVREADIPRLLAECQTAGLLFRFEAASKWYLVLNQWEQGRAKKSRYPDPPPEICQQMQTYVYKCLQMSPTPTPTPTGERESGEPPELPVSAPPAREPRPEPHFPEAVVPNWEEVKKLADISAVPEAVAREFFDHYEANNLWANKHGLPVNVRGSLIVWYNRSKTIKNNANSRTTPAKGHRPVASRNAGTFNRPSDYAGYKSPQPAAGSAEAAQAEEPPVQ